MVTSMLLISNYSLKQINEYKKLLAKTMKLSHTGLGFSMRVKTSINRKGEKNHTMVIKTGNKVKKIGLVPVDFISLSNVNFYEFLNEQSEKILTEEWFYGLKDEAGLDRVVNAMNQEVFGHVLHPTVFDKVSYLWYALATAQFFHNGNKRTAMLAANTVLNLNFYELTETDSEKLYDISVAIAERRMSAAQLKEYLLSHSIVSVDMMNRYLDILNIID